MTMRIKEDISKAIDKVDSREKIDGSAPFTADIQLEGMLHARTFRASVPKALIKDIRLPELPEGYFAVTREDIPGKNIVKMIYEDWPVFAEKEVNHIGEPILLLVGPDKEKVQDLLEAIEIDYEEKKPVFDFTESVVDFSFAKNDADTAFREAEKTIEKVYETGYQEQAYIEPQAFVGYKEGDTTTLVGSIQCPYYVKNAVMETLAAGENEVRVIQAPVGGAFGGKEEFPSLTACQLAVALQKTDRPIKLVYDREEDMEVTTKRHPAKVKMEAAIDKTGRITGMRSHVALDGGAYIGLSGVVLSRGMLAVTNAYTIENVAVKGDVFRTNTVPNGAFRGFGAPQMIFSIEMFIHHIAQDLGLDTYDFRRRHLVKQGDRTATAGLYRDPIILPEMIEKAVEMSDYHEKKKAFAESDEWKGIGMSFFFHGCGFTGSGESDIIKAQVKLRKDEEDNVHILVAAVDMGQGPKTTFRKLVAKVLDIPLEKVVFNYPDTRYVPDSGPTVASRTMMVVGGLLARAAKRLGEEWEESSEQVVVEQYKQPEYIEWDEEKMQGDAYPAYSWGVNVVEVEISKATYEPTIKNVWSVYDLGKAIDERIVLGQIEGGQVQGLAYGYQEVMGHNNGRIMQKNLTDYIIPTAVDVPKMKSLVMDNPYPLGPYGAKGVGELTLVGAAPAVALAIEDAIGRQIKKIPATPEYIMELIRNG